MCILFPSCPFHHHHVITASGFGGASCLRLRKSPWDTSKKTIAMLGYLQQDTTQDLSNPMIQYPLKWHDVNIPDISTFVKHLHGRLSTKQKQLTFGHWRISIMYAIRSNYSTHIDSDSGVPHRCPFPFRLCLRVRRRVQSPSSEVSLAPNRQTPRFEVKHRSTMTGAKSKEVGPTHAAYNTASIIYTISEGLHLPSTCFWGKKSRHLVIWNSTPSD